MYYKCVQLFRFEEATKVYICSSCKLLNTKPFTMAHHFSQCTIVHFEDDEESRSPHIGMLDVPKDTQVYECTVCERMYCLKYYILLHLTERHHVTLTESPTVVLPMEFISMSTLIQEMCN